MEEEIVAEERDVSSTFVGCKPTVDWPGNAENIRAILALDSFSVRTRREDCAGASRNHDGDIEEVDTEFSGRGPFIYTHQSIRRGYLNAFMLNVFASRMYPGVRIQKWDCESCRVRYITCHNYPGSDNFTLFTESRLNQRYCISYCLLHKL